jgi:glutamate--cysteine ligase
MRDWADHLTTIFPEVRLKQYLEMRGADGGPWARLCALPAFWTGILYDAASLDAAWELCRGWNAEERQRLRDDAPKFGLQTKIGNRTFRDLAGQLLELAESGLARRGNTDRRSRDETHFLAPLLKIIETGRTPAEDLLELYSGRWQADAQQVFREFAY